ncbi:Complex 1 LYR protein [Plasmopara halstedii]|uniref:Complex 1 LYR protein n=1 Tax=Plasmopara halstedii TaxID=4781 RepID=A0A0N7L466_PLAHL|nr:Complex 1 LYR protein [Plasmopara halstedii]CEG37819.1 Complex 1 LYR protein [Plasmopara halstedii]|eukprot:XP_024574188.1 Complex 1 LYR protein [Plasmopara halstedii]
MVLLNKRKEVLRLYRNIIRTTRMFPHRNEQGQIWSDVLQKNARMEIEQNRHEKDGETISKRILFGWKCLQEVQEKMMKKQQEFNDKPFNQNINKKE